jgi:hypothetical protein
MTTFNRSYSSHPATHRYTLTFKTTWEQHTQVQDVATESGQSMADACRELLGLGLVSHHSKNVTEFEKPKVRFLRELERVHERQHLLEALASVRGELDDEDFKSYCRLLGFEPGDVDEKFPPGGKRTKEERCQAFLRVLFTDRPDGLPGTRVLEIAAQEGFGQNLTREVASQMSIKFQATSTEEGRVYIWKPAEAN